jgi:hypothetical protein
MSVPSNRSTGSYCAYMSCDGLLERGGVRVDTLSSIEFTSFINPSASKACCDKSLKAF